MQLSVLFNNLLYAASGAILTLFTMYVGYVVFDKITPYDTQKELDEGNVAVGIVIASIFIGVGISVGLVIGLSLI